MNDPNQTKRSSRIKILFSTMVLIFIVALTNSPSPVRGQGDQPDGKNGLLSTRTLTGPGLGYDELQTTSASPVPTVTPQTDGTEMPSLTPATPAEETPSPTMLLPQTETIVPSQLPTLTLPPPANISGTFMENQVLIKISPRNKFKQAIEEIEGGGFVVEKNAPINQMLRKIGYLMVEVDPGSVAQQISRIELLPYVEKAEPNYLVAINDTVPNDPNFSLQYGLMNIHAPQGWDYATGTNKITIAILDTGVDLNSLEFTGKLVAGYDFYNQDSDPSDDHGHGTEVAAVAAAWGNNGFGISGVSWGAQILPVKVLSQSGGGSYSTVAAGIVWAADNHAQVINLSLGGSNAPSNTVLLDAINYAYSQSVTIVASAGNTGGDVMYPARYEQVIAVGATDSANAWAPFSNSGPEIDLCAPGVSILTMTLSDAIIYKNGTSFAAPFVSGLAAILLEIPGYGSPSQVEQLMKNTAMDVGVLGYDINCGAGLIQMDRAVMAALPPTSTPTRDIPKPTNTISFGYGGGITPTVNPSETAMVTDPPLFTLTPTLDDPSSENSVNTSEGVAPSIPLSDQEDEVTVHDGGRSDFEEVEPGEVVNEFIAKNKTISIITICSWSAVILIILAVIYYQRLRNKLTKDGEG